MREQSGGVAPIACRMTRGDCREQRCKDRPRFVGSVAAAPQAREARRRAEFPGHRLLTSRAGDGLEEAALGVRLRIVGGGWQYPLSDQGDVPDEGLPGRRDPGEREFTLESIQLGCQGMFLVGVVESQAATRVSRPVSSCPADKQESASNARKSVLPMPAPVAS